MMGCNSQFTTPLLNKMWSDKRRKVNERNGSILSVVTMHAVVSNFVIYALLGVWVWPPSLSQQTAAVTTSLSLVPVSEKLNRALDCLVEEPKNDLYA
jgi:hypothetical protein